MNKLIFALLLVFIVGCSAANDSVMPTETTETQEGLDEEQYMASKTGYLINIKMNIEKPSPCHTLDVKYGVIEQLPRTLIADVTINPPAEGVMCAQVISYEQVEFNQPFFGFNRVQIVSDGVLLFDQFI